MAGLFLGKECAIYDFVIATITTNRNEERTGILACLLIGDFFGVTGILCFDKFDVFYPALG